VQPFLPEAFLLISVTFSSSVGTLWTAWPFLSGPWRNTSHAKLKRFFVHVWYKCVQWFGDYVEKVSFVCLFVFLVLQHIVVVFSQPGSGL
jgi:hypothetical protein